MNIFQEKRINPYKIGWPWKIEDDNMKGGWHLKTKPHKSGWPWKIRGLILGVTP